MKTKIISIGIAIILITPSLFAQVKGAIKIDNNTWIDKTEVTMLDYFAYLNHCYNLEELEKDMLPDSLKMPKEFHHFFDYFYYDFNLKNINVSMHGSQMRDKLFYSTTYISEKDGSKVKFSFLTSPTSNKDNQLKHYANLAKFPMTGISFEQVQGYIAWKNEMLKKAKITCALPTLEQLKEITEKGIDLQKSESKQIYTETGKDKNGCAMINFKTAKSCQEAEEYLKAQLDVSGIGKATIYAPNTQGIFNLQGNVSEMTSIDEIATGGNYLLPFEACKAGSIQTYETAEPWLGFRLIYTKN